MSRGKWNKRDTWTKTMVVGKLFEYFEMLANINQFDGHKKTSYIHGFIRAASMEDAVSSAVANRVDTSDGKWVSAIDSVLKNMDKEHNEIARLYFFESKTSKLRPDDIARHFNMETRTLYLRINKIIDAVELEAAVRGLFERNDCEKKSI